MTAVKVGDDKVLGKVAVGGDCQQMGLTPGGRFVFAHSSVQFVLVDTSSAKRHVEFKPSGGINSLHVLRDERKILLLTPTQVVVWGADEGRVIDTLEGFHQPVLVVELNAR